jgi:hypothetical protein
MDTESAALLPENTLIYRDYQVDGILATVRITLAKVSEGEQVDIAVRSKNVELCGHILLANIAGTCPPPMSWTYDGVEIDIVAAGAATLPPELRLAIGAFLRHFLSGIEEELDSLGNPSHTVH